MLSSSLCPSLIRHVIPTPVRLNSSLSSSVALSKVARSAPSQRLRLAFLFRLHGQGCFSLRRVLVDLPGNRLRFSPFSLHSFSFGFFFLFVFVSHKGELLFFSLHI